MSFSLHTVRYHNRPAMTLMERWTVVLRAEEPMYTPSNMNVNDSCKYGNKEQTSL